MRLLIILSLILSFSLDSYCQSKEIIINTEPTVENPTKSIWTKATLEQITKKWYLIKKENPTISEEQNRLANSLVKGSYYSYNADGTFEAQVFDFLEKGYWAFNDEMTGILLEDNNGKKHFNIEKISVEELILVIAGGSTRMHFSSIAPQ